MVRKRLWTKVEAAVEYTELGLFGRTWKRNELGDVREDVVGKERGGATSPHDCTRSLKQFAICSASCRSFDCGLRMKPT